MMKLVTDVKKDVVAITAGTDEDGDVVVKANGVSVLWIFRDGAIMLNTLTSDVTALKSMGFKVNDLTGQLVVR